MKRAVALSLCLALPLLAARFPDPEPDGDAKADLKAMQGKWKVLSITGPRAKDKSKEEIEKVRFEFKDDSITVHEPGRTEPAVKFKLDAKKKPKQIDILAPGDRTIPGIYKFDKDKFTLAFASGPMAPRPKGFDDKAAMVIVYAREGKEPPKKEGGKKDKKKDDKKKDDKKKDDKKKDDKKKDDKKKK